MTDKLKLFSNREHEDRSWSWWGGYNYGELSIRTGTVTNKADFWEGLGNYATKRSLQIKRERLEALIKQSYDESAS